MHTSERFFKPFKSFQCTCTSVESFDVVGVAFQRRVAVLDDLVVFGWRHVQVT
jgi:hypothetical protein